jgi:hypothetical protein
VNPVAQDLPVHAADLGRRPAAPLGHCPQAPTAASTAGGPGSPAPRHANRPH